MIFKLAFFVKFTRSVSTLGQNKEIYINSRKYQFGD